MKRLLLPLLAVLALPTDVGPIALDPILFIDWQSIENKGQLAPCLLKNK